MILRIINIRSVLLICCSVIILQNISCHQTQPASAPIKNDQVEKYLDEKVLKPAFGGKVYSAYKIFSTESDKIYIWAYMQEYYTEDDKLTQGTGWSIPLVLEIESKNGQNLIKNHTAPRDGDRYTKDIKRLFPIELHQKILDFTASPELKDLEKTSLERAKKYFR